MQLEIDNSHYSYFNLCGGFGKYLCLTFIYNILNHIEIEVWSLL